MALSLFIKQLLETDSIFGGEAKKLSGINDSSVQVSYVGVDVGVISNATNLALNVFSATNQPTPPPWLIEDKYVSISVTGTEVLRDRQRVLSVVIEANGSYTVNFKLNENGSGTLDTGIFPDTGITIDGRIWAIIDDVTIAREANNGSTMFNVDNSNPTGLEDGSGLVQKYASHYHSEVSFDLVSHRRSPNGQDLLGIQRAENGDTIKLFFDRDAAVAQRALGNEVSFTITAGSLLPTDLSKVTFEPNSGTPGNFTFDNVTELFTLLQNSEVLTVTRDSLDTRFLDVRARPVGELVELTLLPSVSNAWRNGSLPSQPDFTSPISINGDAASLYESGPQLVFDREGNAVFQLARAQR